VSDEVEVPDEVMARTSDGVLMHADELLSDVLTFSTHGGAIERGVAEARACVRLVVGRLRRLATEAVALDVEPPVEEVEGSLDPEIVAMQRVRDALEGLSDDVRRRVLTWAGARYIGYSPF
jgi:hypothetical protein